MQYATLFIFAVTVVDEVLTKPDAKLQVQTTSQLVDFER